MDEPTDDTRRDLDPDDLAHRLAEVRRIRAATRASVLTAGWIALVAWGLAFLGSVPLAFALDGDLGVYWLVAAPLAAVVSYVAGSRQEMHTTDSAWPYFAIGAAMFVGAFGAFFAFSGTTAIGVWGLVLTVGFAAIALLDRQRVVAGAVGAVGVWGLVVWWAVGPTDQDVLYTALATALGALLVGVGAALRMVRS